MTRRASLPGASELFRRTSDPSRAQRADDESGSAASSAHSGDGSAPAPAAEKATGSHGERRSGEGGNSSRTGTPRQKHDSKITVYLSGDELLAMEQARLTLRSEHSLSVDRGRIVREAVAVLLEDLDQHGAESVLVRRLREDGTAD